MEGHAPQTAGVAETEAPGSGQPGYRQRPLSGGQGRNLGQVIHHHTSLFNPVPRPQPPAAPPSFFSHLGPEPEAAAGPPAFLLLFIL